jgi:hypothetical protein
MEKGYYKNKLKEWRLKNPERNKELRRKYKQSEKGKQANKKYAHKRYSTNRVFRERTIQLNKGKQTKEYIKNYIKNYLKNEDNYRKFIIRQKDKYLRKKLIKLISCCQFCGDKRRLELHHKIYDENQQVILLCQKCHKFLHRKYK